VGPVTGHQPQLPVVPELGLKDDREKRLFYRGIGDREEHLHAPVEVPGHKIGTPEEYLVFTVVFKVIDPCMLKEPSDNRAYGDILAHAGDARPQAADPPYLEIDLNPGLRSAVQGTDAVVVDKRVHLEDEMAAPVLPVARDLTVDPRDDGVPEGDRGHGKLPVLVEAGVAGQE